MTTGSVRRLAALLGSLAIGVMLTAAGLVVDVRLLTYSGLVLFGAAALLWLVDWGKVAKAPPASDRATASGASLTLSFTKGVAPSEIANKNVHSWFATSLMITTTLVDGDKQRHVFNQWVIAIWFDADVFNFAPVIETVSGEAVPSTIHWRSERGMLVAVEAPDDPTVIRIHVSSR